MTQAATTTTYRRMVLAELVGIPYLERGRGFDGADCWGVCLLAARHLFNMDLPEYFYSASDMLDEACEHIRRETRGPHWRALPDGGPYPRACIHIFRVKGFETHCGIHVGGGEFLHSLAGRNSCVESLFGADWCKRKTGSFEWTP
jgi:cell wall-associated NlpC family hydrolase